VRADTITDLKDKISDRAASIKQLEEEIKGYQNEIEALGREADSLKKTLAELDISKKKLEADLRITQKKIESTELDIQGLSREIGDKSERIGDGRRVIAQSLASIARSDSYTILENLLGSETLAEAWNNTEDMVTLQSSMRERIHELESIKASLEDNKKKTEQKKAELLSLRTDLANQKKVLADTVQEKNSLLASTKNTESAYKKIVNQKEAQIAIFEEEIKEFESALQIAIDPTKIPRTGSGILDWPLERVKITQYFGNTPFATQNPQIYNGRGHTGVDFAASIGTPVKAALGGTVTGVANTDVIRGCYSYGKWIMVKHANGLSTLYAHLSLQTVAVGDSVRTGQTIGYSGNTGYSTGPHLHFGVYATEGVRITKVTRQEFPRSGCIGATTVFADPKAYLNPLSYL
jgi:murein DD-endopeptidase MepM/ murein hydrolase activator NlpD